MRHAYHSNYGVTRKVIRSQKSTSHKKTSTDEGKMISIKPVLKNPSFAFRENLDPVSNGTEESDPQSEKHLKLQPILEKSQIPNQFLKMSPFQFPLTSTHFQIQLIEWRFVGKPI
jgi:hypothetical protein